MEERGTTDVYGELNTTGGSQFCPLVHNPSDKGSTCSRNSEAYLLRGVPVFCFDNWSIFSLFFLLYLMPVVQSYNL